jgi:hypothetical protein
MGWWVIGVAGFFAGLSIGLLIMQVWVVRPLQNQVLNMRIMGFDPIRVRPENERKQEDELPEYNET